MKNLILFCAMIIFAGSVSAQLATKKPTQKELMIKKSLHYFFLDFPGYLGEQFQEWQLLTQYDGYVKKHLQYPSISPFKYFLGSQDYLNPSDENTFPFVNRPYDFDHLIDTENGRWFGMCTGVTLGHRRMSHLAFFDPQNKFAQKVPDVKTNRNAWIDFQKKKLDRIFSFKPAIIPGLTNVHEYGRYPELKDYLQKHIINITLESNIHSNGLTKFAGILARPSMAKAKSLYKSLKFRMGLGFHPVVFMSKPHRLLQLKTQDELAKLNVGDFRDARWKFWDYFDWDYWIHVLQVVGISPVKSNGTYEISVWDMNEELPEYAVKKVTMQSDGTFLWPEADDTRSALSTVELIPEDTLEMTRILNALMEWCRFSTQNYRLCRGNLKL